MNEDFPVLTDDYGIRPAGPSDACFYCQRRVGANHAPDCVCIVRSSTYGVYHEGRRIGAYTRDDPAFWTTKDCEFHKNDSSWCADNMIGDGYEGEPLPETLEGCLCGCLVFKLEHRGTDQKRATP